MEDDDECIHGLTPTTCSICRERSAPRPVKKAAAPRTPRAPGAPRSARPPAAPRRPASAAASTASLAGRDVYFRGAARGCWWIDQTDRADDEWGEAVVRSERPGGAGVPPAATRNVGEIRTGDLTIHVVGGEIVGVGLATGDGRAVSGPPPGWLAEVTVALLDEPVEVRTLASAYKPGPPHPFTNQGFAQPGICFPYPPDVAATLARKVLVGVLPVDAGPWTELALG